MEDSEDQCGVLEPKGQADAEDDADLSESDMMAADDNDDMMAVDDDEPENAAIEISPSVELGTAQPSFPALSVITETGMW